MNLYLLRHAIALDRSKWRKADSERPLTPEGTRKMRKAARGIRELGLGIEQIFTSPYRRAYDTAGIVASILKPKKKMKVLDALAADGDPESLIKQIEKDFDGKNAVMLVGHEPYLSKLTAALLGAREAEPFELKKGGLSRLSADRLSYGRCAVLKWWLTPKLLKALS